MAASHPKRPAVHRQDLTGLPFGRWSVLRFAGIKGQHAYWLCRCECGATAEVAARHLLGDKSHGCRRCGGSRTHGQSQEPHYKLWLGIKSRACYGNEPEIFKNYRGRGIRMCRRWRESFTAFMEDMGHRPTSKHSIDRINNDAHYSCGHCDECLAEGWPANCRWATKLEQCNNTRANRLVTCDGETATLAEWSRRSGNRQNTIVYRLDAGWPVREAIFSPPARVPRVRA